MAANSKSYSLIIRQRGIMYRKRLIRRVRKEKNIYLSYESGTETPKSSLIKKLGKYSEYSIGVGVLLYILGFIIENVFLGSFGISLFDILKARYILIGFLFAIFFLAVGIPTLDIIKFFRDSQKIPFYKVIIRLAKNSAVLFIALYFVGLILEILSGPQGNLPLGVAEINPIQPFSLWISKAFPEFFIKYLRSMAAFGLIIFCILLLVLILFVAINPKTEEKRISRKDLLKGFFSNVKTKGMSPILDLIGILFLFTIIFPMITSLIVFLTTNKINPYSIDTLNFSMDYSLVFFRFIVAVVLSYLGVSISFISIIYQGKVVEAKNDSAPRLLDWVTGWAFLVAIIITFLVPIYTYGVYPLIPQQIGGGKPAKVNIIANDLGIQKKFQQPNCQPYLIDRTSSSVLVLCTNNNSKTYEVIEVQLNKIDMITFSGGN